MPNPLAQQLDFANHHAQATPEDITLLCNTVIEHGLHAAFVNPVYISLAKPLLAGRAVLGTALSFPLGQDTLATKIAAANEAVQLGAQELDIVPNLGAFLSGDSYVFLTEMREVVDSARMVGKPVIIKFIIETGYFDALPNKKERMTDAALAIKESGADFVKICSGMGPRGASVDDVTIIREAIGPRMPIKVAGGIDTYEKAQALLAAGANRIGTSHAVDILTAAPASTT